jgi:hypothetical protein
MCVSSVLTVSTGLGYVMEKTRYVTVARRIVPAVIGDYPA